MDRLAGVRKKKIVAIMANAIRNLNHTIDSESRPIKANFNTIDRKPQSRDATLANNNPLISFFMGGI